MAYNPSTSLKLTRRQILRSGAAAVGTVTCNQLSGQPYRLPERPAIGLNLAPVKYWMSERPFNNLYLTSSPHVSCMRGGWNDGGPLDLDENGWVRRYQPGQLSAFLIDLKRGHASTVYEVLYDGQVGSIRIQGGNNNLFMKNQPEQRMLVRLTSPLRDLIVRERGFQFTNTFADRFVDRCQHFHTLRFMDWQQTNENQPQHWATRVTDKYYTQAERGVALEHMVDLCNITSSCMWYCVHHLASDEYVRNAARFIKQRLNNGRPVYVEHSNEVWNRQFAQHHYCRERNEDWIQYHIQRTAEVARLFRAEGVEIVSVLGLQSAGFWAAGKALEKGVPEDINATAIAPYFGGVVTAKPHLAQAVAKEGVDRVIDECRLDLNTQRDGIRIHRELADKHGLDLLGYEGGQHLSARGGWQIQDPNFIGLLQRANRHPGMYDLYIEYLDIWRKETDNSLLCLYSSCTPPGKFGSWGLLEYEGQSLALAPKYRAVVDTLNHRRVDA